jgi:hypothetical protein
MNSEKLRLACERAGLKVTPDGDDWYVSISRHNGEEVVIERMWNDHPALPAYVAELLTALAREQEIPANDFEDFLDEAMGRGAFVYATAKQRITACMGMLPS